MDRPHTLLAGHSMQSFTPLRCHALDACTFDNELNQIFQSYWNRIWAHVGTQLQAEIVPETDALLRAILWYLSIGSDMATPGQSLQNISCVGAAADLAGSNHKGAALELQGKLNTKLSLTEKVGSFALTVVVPLLTKRVARSLTTPDSQRWWRRADAASKVLVLMCTLRFLWKGRQPSLPMALLGLHFAYTSPHKPRRADFDFMKQELAWRAFMDLTLGIRLFFGHSHPASAHTTLRSPASNTRPSVWASLSSMLLLGRSAPPNVTGELAELPESSCGFCGADPMQTPHAAMCGHRFCYYCLTMACLRAAYPRCPRCSKHLAIKRNSIARSHSAFRSSFHD